MPKAKKTPGKHYAPRPTSVKIGWLEYAIHWIEDKEWRGMDGVSNDNIGEHRGPQANISIRLAPNVCEDYFREVLLHEIFHGIWFVTDLETNIPAEEEPIVARTSLMFIGVIQENPEVMAYLGGQLYKKKVDQ